MAPTPNNELKLKRLVLYQKFQSWLKQHYIMDHKLHSEFFARYSSNRQIVLVALVIYLYIIYIYIRQYLIQ